MFNSSFKVDLFSAFVFWRFFLNWFMKNVRYFFNEEKISALVPKILNLMVYEKISVLTPCSFEEGAFLLV